MNSHAILRFLQNYAVLIMIAVLMMALGFMSDSFFTLRNLINILNQNAPLAIMASAIRPPLSKDSPSSPSFSP